MEPSSIGVLDIVVHTPLWVWPLLAYSLVAGWRMTRDRTVAPWRVSIMPAIVTAFAVANLVTVANSLAGMAGFAVGTALGGMAGYAIPPRRQARMLDDGRLALAGDWLPLLLLIGIFAARYAQGAALAIEPGFGDNGLFAFAGAAAPAFFAMLMVVRAMRALPAGIFRRRAGRSNAEKYTAPS